MPDSQQVYVVNCDSCTQIIEVVNPRLQERPKKVATTSFGIALDSEIVRMHCPRCGKAVWIRFEY